MNIQAKQIFSQKAFDIYKKGGDLDTTAAEIEAMMAAHNITFNTAHLLSWSSADPVWKNTSLEDFIIALDAKEIKNAQHMKVILERHCNFLHATWVVIKQAA